MATLHKGPSLLQLHVFHTDLIRIQQYHEKQVTLRGGHIREKEGKRRGIWLMYFIFKNEYRIFKPVKITIKMGLREKEEKHRG
jgi:hypothetical protein